MLNKRTKELNGLLSANDCSSISFDDVLKSSQRQKILEELVFLIGYNYIESDGVGEIKAGMFPKALRVVLTWGPKGVSGDLSEAVEVIFNTFVDISLESNVLDLYPRELRDSINKKVMDKNGIDLCVYNQIQSRMFL